MGKLFEIAMEIAKGVEEISLNSNRSVKKLIEEGMELIEKST